MRTDNSVSSMIEQWDDGWRCHLTGGRRIVRTSEGYFSGAKSFVQSSAPVGTSYRFHVQELIVLLNTST